MRVLRVRAAAGVVTVQDRGRPGFLAQGLSRGGAADPVALAEGAALLGQAEGLAAVELMGGALRVVAGAALRIALTGAPMRARLTDGDATRDLAWHASHALPEGAELALAPLGPGFGYLHVGGGVATPEVLGARAAHLSAGIGRVLAAGDVLPLGTDPGTDVDLEIDPLPRFAGGALRAVPSLQAPLFGAAELRRFEATTFRRDAHGSRMGVRLDGSDSPHFALPGGRAILSEIVQPGDVQITGDGTPFVLLAECQTTGGYPRIATVLPCDRPIVAQAPPGAALRVRMVDRGAALAAQAAHEAALAALPTRLHRRRRDAGGVVRLEGVNLIGGAVDARRPDHIDHALRLPPGDGTEDRQ